MPVLVTDRGVLTESPAILGYVAQTFPDAKLADNDDKFSFGDMQAFNVFLTSTVHVAFAHVFRPTRYADGDDASAAMRAKAGASIDEYFSLIEEKLADGRPLVHGDRYTVSDPYLLVFSRWLDRSNLGPVDKFPMVAAHRKRVPKDRKAVRTVRSSARLLRSDDPRRHRPPQSAGKRPSLSQAGMAPRRWSSGRWRGDDALGAVINACLDRIAVLEHRLPAGELRESGLFGVPPRLGFCREVGTQLLFVLK